MQQILIIHGGTSFSTYEAYLDYLKNKQLDYNKLVSPRRWKERIADECPEADVIYPVMPNGLNAVFDEWKIYFEKLIAFLGDDAQIVGHSLGAMFLAKYLNEQPLKNPVNKLLLVAGGYDDDSVEDLGSFKLTSAASVTKSAKEVHLFHSKDDPVVPFSEFKKFKKDIPTAITHVFDDRGHFIENSFPELIEVLKQK